MQIKSRILVERITTVVASTGTGMSIGMIVDKQLDDMVRNAEMCHDISISFTTEEWAEFVDLMQNEFKVAAIR